MLEIPGTTQVLRIATARIDHKAAADERVLNITRKSAGEPVGELMAPEWKTVLAFKEDRLSWETYTEQYRELLRKRYASYAPVFHDLIREIVTEGERLVLTCYCNVEPGCAECHRFLMADILEKIALSEGYEVSNEGDLSVDREVHTSPQLLLGF